MSRLKEVRQEMAFTGLRRSSLSQRRLTEIVNLERKFEAQMGTQTSAQEIEDPADEASLRERERFQLYRALRNKIRGQELTPEEKKYLTAHRNDIPENIPFFAAFRDPKVRF